MKIHLVGEELFHTDGLTDGRTDIVVGRWTDRQADRYDEASSRVLKFC